MTKKEKHIGKSPKQLSFYSQAIGRLPYDSTAKSKEEEELNLPESDDTEEAFPILQKSRRKGRPHSIQSRVSGHFTQHLTIWIIGSVLVPFAILAGRYGFAIDSMNNSINSLQQTIQQSIFNIEERLREQELEIQEHDIKIDYIEEDLDELSNSE